jgi:uncharacterized membrane protein
MFYLPRLFDYHCAAEVESKRSETFKMMEWQLLRGDHEPGHARQLVGRTYPRQREQRETAMPNISLLLILVSDS